MVFFLRILRYSKNIEDSYWMSLLCNYHRQTILEFVICILELSKSLVKIIKYCIIVMKISGVDYKLQNELKY